MARARLLLLFLLLALAPAPPAVAQPAPADLPVVASSPDAVLRAYDERGGRSLCVELGSPDELEPGGSSSCGPAPRLRRAGGPRIVTGGTEKAPTVGGAVVAEAARVEVVTLSGRRVAGDTVPGEAYRGRLAGRVRFFLVTLPARSEPLEVRMLAAEGTLLAVADAFSEGGRPPIAGPVRVGTLRDGSRRLRVEAELDEQLAPSLADPGRRTRSGCLALREGPRSEEEEDHLVRSCVSPAFGNALNFGPQQSCGPARTYVSGFFGPGERAAVVVLGSGGRLRTRTFSLPPAIGVGRAWFVAVPGREAIRRVEVIGGEPLVLGQPPATAGCDEGGFSSSISSFILFFEDEVFGDPITPPVPLAPAAGPLAAADAPDGGLCLAVGRTALRGSDCFAVATEDETRTARGTLPDGREAVGGATGFPTARTASVRFDDGSSAVVPVGDPPAEGYSGAYRGQVRFFAAVAPRPGVEAERVVVRDVRGKAIAAQPFGDAADGRLGPVRRLRGAPPLFVVPLTSRYGLEGPFKQPCVDFRRPRSAADCRYVSPEGPSYRVDVRCASRTTDVVGRVPRDATAVELRLAGGRRRAVPVRPGGYVGIRLGAREALDAVVVRRRRGRPLRTALRLPPAARQCGYGTFA